MSDSDCGHPLSFAGRVAIVTGAGQGLGRSHALALANRGASVVVNDLMGGLGSSIEELVREIAASGGQAIAVAGSVTDPACAREMADRAIAAWGRIDILINNAGILRDKTFAKMSLEDFRLVVDVHLMGAAICSKAVWGVMRDQGYGRIVLTTSSSGLYGNFGQSNYGAAKMGLVGLMQTLALEGERFDIRVNCLAPSAATRMTRNIWPADALSLLDPEAVSAGMLYLACEAAPQRMILCAGAGSFAAANITLTEGVFVGNRADAPEVIAEKVGAIAARDAEIVPAHGMVQSEREWTRARDALGLAVMAEGAPLS